MISCFPAKILSDSSVPEMLFFLSFFLLSWLLGVFLNAVEEEFTYVTDNIKNMW